MKKILALAMVAVMVVCFASVTFAAPADQVAYYAFDDETGLTLTGEDVAVADGVLSLGVDSYAVADVALAGATELTVAMKVKSDMNGDWPFDITSEETHSYPAEHYIGCLLSGTVAVERYANPNGRPATATGIAAPVDTWFDLVCVFPADGSTIVYVDGVEVANVPQTEGFDLAIANCIGETPKFVMGKSMWPDAVNGGLAIDTLAVYTRALAADEVATALEAPAGDAPQTGFATAALAVVAVLSGAYIVTKKH